MLWADARCLGWILRSRDAGIEAEKSLWACLRRHDCCRCFRSRDGLCSLELDARSKYPLSYVSFAVE